MNEQDKQVIERLAELLGWSDCSWLTTDFLSGEPAPVLRGFEEGISKIFLPSRLDGNGMLWLLKEFKARKVPFSLAISYPCPQGSGYDDIDKLPMALNEQCVASLERLGEQGFVWESTR